MALVSGSIVEYFNHDVSSMLFVCGIFAILSAIAVIFTDTEFKGVLRYGQLEEDELESERTISEEMEMTIYK